MSSSFLIRIGLLLIPVALVPFCQLFGMIMTGSEHANLVIHYVATSIPVLFAVAASMTEPNNSRSWQAISTVIVFFSLHYMLEQFVPDLNNRDYICAFFSAIITATFSSHITANTLHLKRYLLSRFLNFGILLICCVITVILLYLVHTLIVKLVSSNDPASLIMGIPNILRLTLVGLLGQLLAPFGTDHITTSFIIGDPALQDIANLKDRILLFHCCSISFFIPAMLLALYFKINSNKKIPVFTLIIIALITSFFPNREAFILLTLIWVWPGLFFTHLAISTLVLLLAVYFPYLADNTISTDINKLINPIILLGTNRSNYIFLAIGILAYFLIPLFIFYKFKVASVSWKIKKRKNVRIRLISDRKGSQDLSLLAIRTMKLAGGIDNLKWIKATHNLIKIGYYYTENVNLDALKGVGTDSRIDNNEHVIYIYTDNTKTAENLAHKIIIFAERQFANLSEGQEGKHHAMDTN